MSTRTKAQVVTYCAEMMGLIGTGGTETGDMSTDLGLAYDQVYEEMEARQLIDFASANVPSKYVEYMAGIMAIRRAHRWDIPEEVYARIRNIVGADGMRGMAQMREMQATTWSGQVTAGEFM